MPLTGAIPEGRNSAYAARLQRLASLLDRSASHRSVPIGDLRGSVGAMAAAHRIVSALPETREPFWRVFTTCARENPNATTDHRRSNGAVSALRAPSLAASLPKSTDGSPRRNGWRRQSYRLLHNGQSVPRLVAVRRSGRLEQDQTLVPRLGL